jgi:hypothetical protein
LGFYRLMKTGLFRSKFLSAIYRASSAEAQVSQLRP